MVFKTKKHDDRQFNNGRARSALAAKLRTQYRNVK